MAIVVVGYPRSGSVWLARLLGDALNCRVTGMWGGRGTLAAEGFEREGTEQVFHLHAKRGEGKHVLMMRDPRDVAVSVAEFWDWSIDEALDRMINGPGPLDLPPWREYMDALDITVWYRYLHLDTANVLRATLFSLGESPVNPLDEVVERQSFSVKKADIEKNGDNYPFGKAAQLKHMRNGRVGEWRDVFTVEQAQRAEKAWGDIC